jgi:hypothetical protein
VSARRVRLGADAVIVVETADGVELEGWIRLRPGQPVLVVPESRRVGAERLAWVITWRVARIGPGGLKFTGLCRWAASRESATRGAQSDPPGPPSATGETTVPNAGGARDLSR